jgi:hypothetical protein
MWCRPQATFKLDKLFEDPTFKEAIVKIQRWPRDIDLEKAVALRNVDKSVRHGLGSER